MEIPFYLAARTARDQRPRRPRNRPDGDDQGRKCHEPQVHACDAGTKHQRRPQKLLTAPHGELFVVDENGALTGTITLEDLADGAFDHSIDDVVNARDVARLHPPVLEAEASSDHALKMMQDTGEEHVAVVENRDSMKLVGFIHEIDVMFIYNRALLEARREERGEL